MYVSIFESVERVYELIRKTIWDEGRALMSTANTFKFCVVFIARSGSTTVLPLYSNMNCTAGMLCIGFISDQQHFIQVSGDQQERESHEQYSLNSVAEDDCEGRTTAYNHQCKHWEEWSMSLSINATVPQTTMPPQISS
ncbi:hypothetical protein M9H77_31748 [Catharanthus roseus]|uniref:Uncharacterized protein n=1 Tax=Catharanthus roseus TaxID=4058 RepID=A0ACC0A1W8_CATRO|nr:hypothetical protein M9H77_31748 [Catharanthus roseus]